MNSFKIFSLLFVVVFITGCAHHDNNTVIIQSSPADSIFTEIHISGVSVEQTDITFVGGKTCQFDIDTVEVRDIYGNCTYGHFGTSIFITPGDSVSFKTIVKDENSYEVIFKGKNAAHYNYASQKEKSISQAEPDFFSNQEVDLLEYKKQLQDYRDEETKFLNNYKKEHKVSEDFINYASSEINNLYAFKLYQAAYFNKCKISKTYLDDADITQNSFSSYTVEALQFKYIYCSPDTNMERIYNTILTEVHPKFQSTLLSTLVTWFATRGDNVYKESLLKVMDQIEKSSTDSTLLATVKEYKPYYLLSGTMLPDSILDKTYLRSFQSKQKISLRQFFENYKNTAIFLDFWGSWCTSCRYANKASAVNKSYFAEKNIAIVYVAWDNENAWLQAVNEDNIAQNQYLLLLGDANNLKDTPIDDYLKIIKNGFPRYILFNKNHEIEILSAPKPTGCLFEELKEIIER